MLFAILVWMLGVMKAKLNRAFTVLTGWMGRARELVSRISGREPAPLMGLAVVAYVGVLAADWCFHDAANVARLICFSAFQVREFVWFLSFWLLGVWLVRSLPWGMGGAVFVGVFLMHCERHCFSKGREFARSLPTEEPVVCRVTGEVRGVPQLLGERGKAAGCRFRLWVSCVEGCPKGAATGFQMLVHWNGAAPGCGDVLRFRAQVRRIAGPRNPFQFDAASFYMREGVWAEALVLNGLNAEVLSPGEGMRFPVLVERVRSVLCEHLRIGLEDRVQTHSLLSSMMFGVHGDSLMEVREYFRDTGTLHLFAVSGLNMTMLGAMLAAALRLAGARGRFLELVVFLVVVLYAIATGMGASSLRAILMGCLVLVGRWISRPALLINSLGAAALISIVEDTNAVFRIGFQLSFGLVLGLALFGRPVASVIASLVTPDELVPRPLWKDWQWRRIRVWKPVAVAMAASIGSWISVLPWSVFLMHQITPIAMLVNLVVVPMAFVNLALGFASLLCAPFLALEHHALSGVAPLRGIVTRLNAGNGWIVDRLMSVVKGASEVPYGNVWIGYPFRKRPDFLVFDVGDGGAVLLNDGRESWLLDCGSVVFANSVVVPAMQGYGVGTIAGLILSHGDSAHLGGIDLLHNRIRIRSVLHSGLKDRSPVWRKFEQRRVIDGNPVMPVVAGDVLATGEVSHLEVLYPPDGLRAALADDKCLVLRWRTKFGSVLYTADSGFTAERWLLEHRRSSLKSDVWVRGVHESDLSGTDDFVNAIEPRLIVVSDTRRRFSSPGIDEWVRRWRDAGLRVWTQRECGAVEGFVEKGGLRCVGFLRENCLLPLRPLK